MKFSYNFTGRQARDSAIVQAFEGKPWNLTYFKVHICQVVSEHQQEFSKKPKMRLVFISDSEDEGKFICIDVSFNGSSCSREELPTDPNSEELDLRLNQLSCTFLHLYTVCLKLKVF